MVFPDNIRLIFLMSAVGSVKENLSEKASDKALSCGCYHELPLSHCAVGWYAVCDCSSSWSYSHFKLTFSYTVLENGVAKTTEQSLMMSIVICMSSKRISDYESDTEMNR